MLGYLADLITTVSYCNEYLRHGGEFIWRTLWLICNPMFKDGELGSEKIIARGIDGWYRYLKDSGCNKLRIFYRDSKRPYTDKNGFYYGSIFISESITWFIETVYEDYSDYWEPKWFGRWGWNGDYYKTAYNQPVKNKQKDLEIVRRDLEDKLKRISEFALENGLSNYSGHFKNNIKILNSYAEEPKRGLIIEENYGQLARRIFHAAQASWCFTGMGSWADIQFPSLEINRESDKVTRELFLAVCDAYVYTINSY